jgi:hypothetical protein
VSRGAYLPSEEWQSLDTRQRYLVRIASIASSRRTRAVLSHLSAAAVWNLPVLGAWPTEVHTTIPTTAVAHSRNGVVQHKAPLLDEDVVEIGGFLVTSIPRTVIDLAMSESFLSAVIAADRALLVDRFGRRPSLTTRGVLEACWERATPRRAHRRATAVLRFAGTRSESPLESVSRVNLRAAGLPRPQLQVPHYDDQGFIGEPDFCWPEFGLIGEADGDIKYLDVGVRGDRSAERVVLDEKIREDRFRSLGRGVARWRWKTAMSPALLRQQLVAAGLPTGVKW